MLAPRPYLLGDARYPLTAARQYYIKTIPPGAGWSFKFLLANYLRTTSGGGTVQDTPDLSYRLYDADGRAFHVSPVLLPMVTSPAGAAGLDATNLINIHYPGGSSIKLEIEGSLVGTGPSLISLTLYGIRGWERLGGR
jgi:hypothetical protein